MSRSFKAALNPILQGDTLRPDCEECHGSGILRDDELIADCSYCVDPALLAPLRKFRIRVYDDRMKKKSRRAGRGTSENPADGSDYISFCVLSFHFMARDAEAADTLATRYIITNHLGQPYNLQAVR